MARPDDHVDSPDRQKEKIRIFFTAGKSEFTIRLYLKLTLRIYFLTESQNQINN